jgi:hypothetical protein
MTAITIPATNAAAEPQPSTALLEALKNTRPSKTVRVPFGAGRDVDSITVREVLIRPLTVQEQIICSVAAEAFCKKPGKSDWSVERDTNGPGQARLFADAYRIETLSRACLQSDDQRYPAFTTDDLRQFSSDELDALFRHYLTICSECSPFAHDMPDDELDAWLARMAADGSAFSFDLLSPEQQRTLLLFAAFKVAALTAPLTDNGVTA